MSPKRSIVPRLAAAFLLEDWSRDGLLRRGRLVVGRGQKWLRPLVGRIIARWPSRPPQLRELSTMLSAEELGDEELAAVLLLGPPPMRPSEQAAVWRLPEIATPGELAQRLGLSPGELDWFADVQGRQRHIASGPLQHYCYRWIRKRHGGARLIESPKERLKMLQRQILREIVDRIPAHDAAHGFRRERSVRTFVAPHVARPVVLKIDLRDFFPSIHSGRVMGLFLSVGYPEQVARLLTGLCTNRLPGEIMRQLPEGIDRDETLRLTRQYDRRHLPQGAPTSPALANLCAYMLDVRLAALAAEAGGRYTRYADDLLFSGDEDFARSARRFHVQAARIAMEEGFVVQFRKTRIMRPGVRQHAAGLTLNVRPNIRRRDYDRLKATLHHCLLHGPAGENREAHADFRAHLAGRIGYLSQIHPARGEKLQAIFDQIEWSA